MRVELLEGMSGSEGSFAPGDIVDVSDTAAQRYIERGIARMTRNHKSRDIPLIVYLQPDYVNNGSNYKWVQMLKRMFGGVQLFGDAAKQYHAARVMQPDLCVVAGDASQLWTIPKRLGVPYLLLQHDSITMRTEDIERYGEAEREMVQGASAILYASEEHEAYMADRYDVSVPTATIHLRPLREQLAFAKKRKIVGKRTLVYSGGIAPRSSCTGPYGYRCYHDIFAAFAREGWEVHAYRISGWTDEVRREYEAVGVVCEDSVPHSEMAREASQYTASFQGYAETGGAPGRYIETCRPNKLWEGLGAGIPTIGYNTGRGAAIYDGKWGVALDSLNSIPSPKQLPKVTDAMRFSQVMENDSDKFAYLMGACIDLSRWEDGCRYRV